jgi:hypothetical protein
VRRSWNAGPRDRALTRVGAAVRVQRRPRSTLQQRRPTSPCPPLLAHLSPAMVGVSCVARWILFMRICS